MKNININNLKNIKNRIDKVINSLEKKYIKRDSKITIKNIFYGLIYKSLNNNSYDDITNMINYKNIDNGIYNKTFTTEAFIIKKNKIDSKYFLNLNNSLIECIYDDKERLLAVDGSTLNLSKKFNNYNFPFASKKKTYCKGYLSCLFDVYNKIPINYHLSIKNNERESFLEQSKYLKENDIIIFDRGYHSEELLLELEKINIKYIFRIKKSLNIVKKLVNKDEYLYEENKIKRRLIKYVINKNNYYILTNLFNKTIEEIKDNYWSRWEVEVNFKKAKFNLSLETINCKLLNSLEQDIYINHLNFILYYYLNLETNIDLKNKNKCKINDKAGIKFFIENTCYLLTNKKLTNKQIFCIDAQFGLIRNTKFYIQENRNFKRKSVIKKTKWYYNTKTKKKDKEKKDKEKKNKGNNRIKIKKIKHNIKTISI